MERTREYSDPNLQGHIPVLDGLRGIAILLVILFHTTRIRATAPIDDIFFMLGRSAWVGVDLFFVLSGFLITGILVDAKGGKNFFRTFYARRSVRIFPLYYLVVAFCVFIAPALPVFNQMRPHPAEVQWWYWLYGSNFLAAQQGLGHIMLGPTWSLAIEEQFYLVWPLLIYFCSRRVMIGLSLALICAAVGLRFFLLANGYHPSAIYVLTPTRFDPLAIGALIALLARGAHGFHVLIPWARAIAIVGGSVLLYFLSQGYLNKKLPIMIQYGYILTALFFGALLVLLVACDAGGRVHAVCSSKTLTFFGKYSYALYLFNSPLVYLVHEYVFDYREFPRFAGSSIPGQLVFTVIVLCFSILFALLSWHLFEKQFLKLKRYFPVQKQAGGTATALARYAGQSGFSSQPGSGKISCS